MSKKAYIILAVIASIVVIIGFNVLLVAILPSMELPSVLARVIWSSLFGWFWGWFLVTGYEELVDR